jgi:hypothetical protein
LSKKKKIKPRRKFDRGKWFNKKETMDLFVKDRLIRDVFPDPEERQEYIQALIDGLNNEPILELKDGDTTITTRTS